MLVHSYTLLENYLSFNEWGMGVDSTQDDGGCETRILRLFEETLACEKQYEEFGGKWFVWWIIDWMEVGKKGMSRQYD